MGNFIKTQNSFAAGEISKEFYAINNSNGVSKLENMDVLQSGAIKRRSGLKSIKSISSDSILIPFVINEDEKYLLIVSERFIDIYKNDTKITAVVVPWLSADLSKLQYVQRFNSVYFVHPDYMPVILNKNGNDFSVSYFNFHVNDDMSINIPFIKFDDAKNVTITITSSTSGNNYATFTTNVDFWTNDNVGETLFVNNKQWIVSSVSNARVATVRTNGDFSLPNSPITDWYEAAFSNKRGWPISVSFHQNRLIFGGTKSKPNGIWMSKIGDYNNFDFGTGLDDEAIYTELLSEQHHQISTLVSSDKLQVLTSAGEWGISNSPLTPSEINIKQHTNIGSFTIRYLPPQQIEGRTVFISKSGKDIRELDLDVLGENYNATDLSVFSKHLMKNPVSIAFNQSQYKLFVVMEDGYIAVLHLYLNTEISAWGTYKTDGYFKYVCVLGNDTYVIVKRQGTCFLEKFDDTCLNDAEQYGFSYTVSSLPMITNNHFPKKIRLRKISVRLQNTKTLFVNNYRMEIPNDAYMENSGGFSGDLSMNLFGTQNDTMQPLWVLSSSEQLPTTVLSVNIDGFYII
ncbi:MAG: hypothetical protein IKN73_04110 [Alphaproteobacteria bacterium]|nr:hypothetical protein [Alphaproteobacteria bacterium]